MKRIGRMAIVFLLLVTIVFTSSAQIYASNAYYINGKYIHWDDFSSSPDECWVYANNIYNKIWGKNFSNSFSDSDNSLRNLSDAELTLTAEHLKKYVSNAALGSSLRICNSNYLHGTDGWGHSQIIVQKDANGFTVFEGGTFVLPVLPREILHMERIHHDRVAWGIICIYQIYQVARGLGNCGRFTDYRAEHGIL